MKVDFHDEELTEQQEELKGNRSNKTYELADVRTMTEQNADIDYKILLALYEHRALTPIQIKKLYFPEKHENSIRNRLRTLAKRKVLTVNVRFGAKTRPVHMYSLATFGLRIFVENVLQVREYVPQLDEVKEHYTIDDLKVRHQHQHHYELQEWLSEVLSKKYPELFHCEWRRLPFVEDDENVYVKPDWVFIDVEKEVVEERREDVANNPVLYPYFYRQELFPDFSFECILSVECDRGTMNRLELIEKWDRYRNLPEKYKPKAVVMFYYSHASNNSDMRHRLIRESMAQSFELEVVNNEVQLFEGDANLTQEIILTYFSRREKLIAEEPMTDEQELMRFVEKQNEIDERREISLLDVSKTVERFKLPVEPDAIILTSEDGKSSIQFVFYSLAGWVNPFIKVHVLRKWIDEGNLSIFDSINFVMLYPDHQFLKDIRPTNRDIYYVSYQEIQELGVWGKAHIEQRRSRKVKWMEVQL